MADSPPTRRESQGTLSLGGNGNSQLRMWYLRPKRATSAMCPSGHSNFPSGTFSWFRARLPLSMSSLRTPAGRLSEGRPASTGRPSAL